jgi:xylose isomerase
LNLEALKLLGEFSGFLEGSVVDEFIDKFNIKLASGTWAAGNYYDRFMVKGYHEGLQSDIKSRIERVRRAGIRGVLPVNTEFLRGDLSVDWELVDEVLELTRSINVEIAGLGLDLSGVPLFKHGSITNPDSTLRRRALELLVESLEVAKKLRVEVVSFWPGQDGWDYNFEVNYSHKLKLFIDGLLDLARECMKRGLKLAIEAKPKEPREGNMIIPTTHAAVAIARLVNKELGVDVVGVTIDYGHELMYAVEPAYTVHFTKALNVPLLSIHINTAKTHSNDEDRVVGVGDLWQLIDFLLATLEIGYRGWYVLDQFMYRMDPVEGLRLSKELFVNAMKKALAIYKHRDLLEEARASGDQVRVLDIVKKIIYNY